MDSPKKILESGANYSAFGVCLIKFVYKKIGKDVHLYTKTLDMCYGVIYLGVWSHMLPLRFIDCADNCFWSRQSLLSLHMTKSYVRTATRSTLKVEANLTQILNFKANFHTEFEPFFKKKIYANNGGHFKIVSIKIKN